MKKNSNNIIHNNKEKITLKIILLGSISVGKSSLINRYINGKFIQTRPTIGVDFATKVIESEELIINLQIYDTAGTEKYHYQLGSQFYRNADGAILVYDLSRPAKDSLDQLMKWKDEVLTKSYVAGDNDFKLPIVVAGNKADLKTNDNDDNEIIHNFCKDNDYGHIETSAKDSFQVEAAVLAVTSLALTQHRKKKDKRVVDPNIINLNDLYKKKQDNADCFGCS